MTSRRILCSLAAACLLMALVDAVLRPGYLEKSLIKLALFLLLPWLAVYRRRPEALRALFRGGRQALRRALLPGLGLYLLILGLYLTLGRLFDFSGVASSLEQDLGVHAGNFLWVSLYISFVNSLLEEFFFRGFAFLTLARVSSRRFAAPVSAVSFALYHVAMLLGWFSPGLLLLLILALAAAGLLFNACCARTGSLFLSWLLHMSANFAINTVGFLLLTG